VRRTSAILFLLVFGAIISWVILKGIFPAPQLPVAPTSIPKADLILEIPQKALWRNYLIISAEAAPGTTCDLLYIPPSGDSQETSSVADNNGNCSWRWKIEETDGKGNARLIFTVEGVSETHFIEIRRSF
jgi:hypothetical protein